MKNVLAAILALALVAVLALFFGLGIATGGLPLALNGPSVKSVTGGPTGLAFHVGIGANLTNGVYVSDYLPNGSSEPIYIWTDVWGGNGTSCPSSPGWNAGSGGNTQAGAYFYYELTVTFNGQSESIPGTHSGALFVSGNSSPEQYSSCPPTGTTHAVSFQNTIYLPGSYQDDSILTVKAFTWGYFCNGGLGGASTTMCAPYATSGGSIWCVGSPPVSFLNGCSTAYSQIVLRSGYSALYQPSGTFYNGGTLPIGYSTGFSTGAWKICFQYPAIRGGANIACNNIGSNSQATTTFSIPNNASKLVTNCAVPCTYNLFQATLYNSLFPGAFIPSISIDVSPQVAPGTPQITWTDTTHTGGVIQQGDSITVSVTASNPGGQNGTINGFILAAYYSVGESTPPISASYWIGANPQGVAMTLTATSSGATGSYTFVVNQGGSGNGATIVGTVTAVTTLGQSSQNSFTVQVTPGNCGTPTCGNVANGLWQAAAPILLVSALILATALAVVLVPTMPLWLRVFLPIMVAAATIGLLALGVFTPWFAPGGPL